LPILGRFEDAISEMKRAKDLDPLTPLYTAWLGSLYSYVGRHQEMIEEARKALQLAPNYIWGLLGLGRGYSESGRHEEAIATYEDVVARFPAWKWRLGNAYALAGRRSEALQVAKEIEGKPGSHVEFGLGVIYAVLGDTDQSLRWLEKAYEARDSYMPWIGVEPVLAGLRGDP
jgi:tetratricopeptide (TPR) repeat protein